MAIGTNKEFKLLIKRAEKQGWSVTQNRSSHLKWVNPKGGLVFSALSPSDWRAVKNLIRDLKHNGFKESVK